MNGHPGVVVLRQNPLAEVLVPGNNNFTLEIKQAGFNVPFGGMGGASTPDLEETAGCNYDRFLQVRLTGEASRMSRSRGTSAPATATSSSTRTWKSSGRRSVPSSLSEPTP